MDEIGWLYDWTHSSALGKPDEHFTGFTTDEARARKHDNPRPVYARKTMAEPAGHEDDIEAVIACLEDDAAGLRDENPADERATNMEVAAATIRSLCKQLDEARAAGVNAVGEALPFDPGYVYAYLKAALLSVEPEGLTDPQAAYFMEWFEQMGSADGVRGTLNEQEKDHG